MTTSGPYTVPPWGGQIDESRGEKTSGNNSNSHSSIGSDAIGARHASRPRTRTEMLRTRREGMLLNARNMTTQPVKEDLTQVPSEWWKLAEGYRENPLDYLASSPRFQRYMSRRARAHAAAESPDPFGTHEVRLRKPSGSGADKISNAPPPPSDTEAYVAPKRTLKRYTDEFFEWKARLISHGDLDEHGKSKIFTLDEREPPYSSLSSTFTGCSIDPKNNIRSARQASSVAASHPSEKPSAADVARHAIEQRRKMRMVIVCGAAGKHCRKGRHIGDDNMLPVPQGYSSYSSSRPVSASSAHPKYPTEGEARAEFQLRPLASYRESNRRRYSRLCGQGYTEDVG